MFWLSTCTNEASSQNTIVQQFLLCVLHCAAFNCVLGVFRYLQSAAITPPGAWKAMSMLLSTHLQLLQRPRHPYCGIWVSRGAESSQPKTSPCETSRCEALWAPGLHMSSFSWSMGSQVWCARTVRLYILVLGRTHSIL